MASSSPESLALRYAYGDIAEILEHQASVIVLARKLYSLGIITRHTKNQISNHSAVQGVEILLRAIESRLQKKPSAFNTFITCLSEEAVFSEVVEKLKTERQAMQGRVGKKNINLI